MKQSSASASAPTATPALRVRVVTQTEDLAWFDAQLAAQHYLGAGRAIGDYLRQVVEVEGRAAALLVWGPACYALKDRDLWISWSASQRIERLKLIVQGSPVDVQQMRNVWSIALYAGQPGRGSNQEPKVKTPARCWTLNA